MELVGGGYVMNRAYPIYYKNTLILKIAGFLEPKCEKDLKDKYSVFFLQGAS